MPALDQPHASPGRRPPPAGRRSGSRGSAWCSVASGRRGRAAASAVRRGRRRRMVRRRPWRRGRRAVVAVAAAAPVVASVGARRGAGAVARRLRGRHAAPRAGCGARSAARLRASRPARVHGQVAHVPAAGNTARARGAAPGCARSSRAEPPPPPARAFSRLSAGASRRVARDRLVQRQQADVEEHDPHEQDADSTIQTRPRSRRSSSPLGARARSAGSGDARSAGAVAAAARGAGPTGVAARTGAERARRGAAAACAAGAAAAAPRHQRAPRVLGSLRATRRRPDRERGLAATSPGVGADRAARDQLGLGLAAADADREVRRADAPARALGEEALHAPVLERVEGDRGEPAAGAQQIPGRRQRALERAELVVHGDPDRLEHALGGMPARRSCGGAPAPPRLIASTSSRSSRSARARAGARSRARSAPAKRSSP